MRCKSVNSDWSRSRSSRSVKVGAVGRTSSVGVVNEQLLCGEQRDDTGTVGGDDDLLLDAGGREAVRGGAEGLEREDHALFELHRVLEGVEPADDRALVQREAEAVAELQAERRHLVLEAELGRGRPEPGDLV